MNKLKKFLITGAAVITMVASLSGCTSTPPEEQVETEEVVTVDDRIRVVYQSGSDMTKDGLVNVYVDTETGVMYMYVKSGYTGGLIVMVDENGKPLIWEGEEVSSDE